MSNGITHPQPFKEPSEDTCKQPSHLKGPKYVYRDPFIEALLSANYV